MRERYYWYDEIPHFNDLNYFQAPATFFKSLLSADDKISSIDSLVSVSRSVDDTEYSYGLRYAVTTPLYNDTACFARIAYVAHDSPAESAGLQRGDWIMEMDGEPITQKNYARLNGGAGMTLTVGSYDLETDSVIARDTPVQLGAARIIDDNPVYYNKVYERAGKRIGYLVYNRFRSGTDDNATDRPYDRALLEASKALAGDGAGDEFVLDLRYNEGTDLTSAELLCTLLVPADALGKVMGYARYNDRIGTTTFNFDPTLIAGGENLHVHTLYVLTTTRTAAASEMLINCLKPYMTVVLIGQKTAGKNMVTESYASRELMIRINPVVCRLENSENNADYTTGFTPDYLVDENNYAANYLPFGDEQEALLGTALSIIDGTYNTGDE
jgi:C-terminal processing protease CtpA/Prc